MTNATRTAKELHNFFNNFRTLGGSALEQVFLDNARRVSTPLALPMLAQMGLTEQTNTPFTLLENACGVGVVAPILQQIVKPKVLSESKIVCGDFSEQVVELAKQRSERDKWVNTEVKQVDAQVSVLTRRKFISL